MFVSIQLLGDNADAYTHGFVWRWLSLNLMVDHNHSIYSPSKKQKHEWYSIYIYIDHIYKSTWMVVYPYSWTHPHLQWTFTVPLPQPCHARHFALSPQCSSTRLARSHPPSPAAEVQVVHSYGWNMLEPFILSDTVLDTVFHCHNHNWFSLIDPKLYLIAYSIPMYSTHTGIG